MNKLMWLPLLLLVPLVASGTEPAEACVTIVADLQGTVVAANAASAKPEDRWPVQLLQCFAPRKVLTLDASARATLFFPASGEALGLRGPGQFEVTADAVRPLADSVAPSRTQLNAAFREIKLDRSTLAPAGMRMRDPRLVDAPALLEPRGIVLSTGPLVFRWQATDTSRRYLFQVARGRGEVIYETAIEGTEVVLPGDVALTPGERLLWHAEDAASARTRPTRWQEFVIATPDVRAVIAEIDREVPSPSAVERNLRDLLLMQRMLRGKLEP